MRAGLGIGSAGGVAMTAPSGPRHHTLSMVLVRVGPIEKRSSQPRRERIRSRRSVPAGSGWKPSVVSWAVVRMRCSAIIRIAQRSRPVVRPTSSRNRSAGTGLGEGTVNGLGWVVVTTGTSR
ncbi:hypothetical protein Psuf_039030 [Phytohabitans suffuscus]|uniref:Uncharacterized protein n=1 Tax=Phytohabitans suffuscus TaxID=624315 RepID=A0A6F8YKH4_9ACTN|nr:hypothetical protein Psuf_039030 [Phytohabitans suffuscus]